MAAPRRLAARLLRAVVRLAPRESREWASAMLHELDFIGGDWAALFWALGSAAAILRHAASMGLAWLKRKTRKELTMNNIGKKVKGVGLGAISALMLVGCALAVLRIAGILLPGLDLEHAEWTRWAAVIGIPEAIFVTAAVILWRKKGPVAAGILTTALMVGLHVAVHLAMR
jgi:hypothetical protein